MTAANATHASRSRAKRPRAETAEQAGGTSLIKFRAYQQPVFLDRSTGLQILYWSRQIGKSFTLGSWMVDRAITRPGRLITVLSNSRDNGAELNQKCGEVCRQFESEFEQEDLSPDLEFENLNMETRIKVGRKYSRIKVLAANPRTARGFSGDLVMDEFAFHEDSYGIWEAAEPILSANPDYLCRIASTPNGTHNAFFNMVTCGQYSVSKVRRSDAWKQGLKIYDVATRKPITPDEARAAALDKRAYDQNYELIWADSNTTLLTHELINTAASESCGVICEQEWSDDAVARMCAAIGPLYVGVDVGRSHDITVISVLEKLGYMYYERGTLRLEGMRLPQQQRQLGVVCDMKMFRRAAIDMTGIGLGLTEYSQDEFGASRILGVNFSSTVPMNKTLEATGRKGPTVRVTEAMATELLQVHEDKSIKYPIDQRLREDMRKPEKVVSPGGQVSIAASRDGRDHADHFWAKGLAIHAASASGAPPAYEGVEQGGSRENRGGLNFPSGSRRGVRI